MPTRLLFALLPLALATCAPPPLPPTVINASVTTTADVNAGPNGTGAPISLRVYQLASPAGFEGAQFFPVFNTDAAVLKDDLVKRDDLLLAPGQSKTLTLSPPDRAKAIGVLAAYRDYESVAWRAVVAIPANQTSSLAVMVGKAGVTLKITPAKP